MRAALWEVHQSGVFISTTGWMALEPPDTGCDSNQKAEKLTTNSGV
jgi:hypothetical protein